MRFRPKNVLARNRHITGDGRDLTSDLSHHPLLRALETCGGSTREVDQVQAQLLVSGLFHHPLFSGRLVRKLCSSSSSSTHRACSLFPRLDYPDAFISNTIVKSLSHTDGPHSAFHFYRRSVVPRHVHPNNYTFPLLAKLSADTKSAVAGESTHAQAFKWGLLADLYVRNSLIHMYSCVGNIEAARALFDLGVDDADLFTWNSMIDGYVKNRMLAGARRLFDQMPERDVVSWNLMISGCAGQGVMESAEELFSKMPDGDTVSWNTMIVGYARIDEVVPARILFDSMPAPNLVSWNTMLALYVRKKCYEECMRLFDRMLLTTKVVPNEATLVSVLTACANLGWLERGRWLHSCYIRDSSSSSNHGGGLVQTDVLLLTALLTMYAKCGDLDSAKELFDQMPDKSVVSWNSMIMAYGTHGRGKEAVELFLEMEKNSTTTRPNDITLLCVLSACTHAGLVFEGWWCFDRVVRFHGVQPNMEHYGCMVDLLSKAGQLDETAELINEMMMNPPPAAVAAESSTPAPLFGSLLSACTIHQFEWELGKVIGKRLIDAKPGDVGAYVAMSNIYATLGRWDEVEKIRKAMRERGLVKASGTSFLVSSGELINRPGESGLLEYRGTLAYSTPC